MNIKVQKYNYCIVLFISIVVFIISMIARIPRPNTSNYGNSDATYHVLLTIKAYDTVPISTHKFLPIVTLGNLEEKKRGGGFLGSC